MTVMSDNAADLSAAQLESANRAVRDAVRTAFRQVLAEPLMTVEATSEAFRKLSAEQTTNP